MQVSVLAPRRSAKVREVFSGGHRGIGYARNLGVESAQGELIAYLDDDDIWLPHHLHAAVATLRARQDVAIYACSALIAHPEGARRAPKVVYNGRGSLIDFFAGRWALLARERTIPCTTWVFRRDLGLDPGMDPSLTDRMDIWWLLQQASLGRRILQSAEVGTVWYEDPKRTAARWSLEVTLDWARRLDTLKHGAGDRFLVAVTGRRLARAGDQSGWEDLWRGVARSNRRLTREVCWERRLLSSVLRARSATRSSNIQPSPVPRTDDEAGGVEP